MSLDDVSDLPNMLTRALDLVAACLADTPNGAPGDTGLYHGTPPADCCDGLYLWLEQLYGAKGFPAAWSGAINCGEMTPVARVALRLYRPCWPTLVDNPFSPFPPATESDIAAANLQMDAIKMFCCLLGDLSDSNGVILGGSCLAAAMGSTEPVSPQGGCAGWTLRFTIGLDNCCL